MRSLSTLAISAVAAALLAPAAGAQDNLTGVQQSEWAESFDAQSLDRAARRHDEADPFGADRAGHGAGDLRL